jgi:probable rRNA maturation factor
MASIIIASIIPMVKVRPKQTGQRTEPMEILIEDRQNRLRIDHDKVEQKAKDILNALESPDGELSILIVTDQEMAELNRTYLNRSGPTNVMAFPMQAGPSGNITPTLLGDVVISLETAAREAEQAGITTEYRFDQLLIHGILHLFGFDHDKTAEGARAMRIKEEELLTLLCPSERGF